MFEPTSLFTLTSVGHDLHDSLRSARALKELENLPLIVLLTGHSNAGYINNVLREEFLLDLQTELIGTFDVDQLLNYRDRRPPISFVGDHYSDYKAPTLRLLLGFDQAQSPFLLLVGPEPDLQWERFILELKLVIEQLKVKLTVIVDGVPMPVPHTRPIGMTAHGNAVGRLSGLSTFTPTVDLPASLNAVLEYRLMEAEHQVLGISMLIPHYLAETVYPQGAVAAVEYLSAATGLLLPSDRLRQKGRELDQDIADQIAQSEEAIELVDRLESSFDEAAEEKTPRSLLVDVDEKIPSADEIAHSLQEFLSSQPRHTGHPEIDGPGSDSGPEEPRDS